MKQIFLNGKIFGKNNEYENSIFINDGRIVLCGTREEVLLQKEKGTKVEDLNGKNIMPAAYIYTKSIFAKNAKNSKIQSKTENFFKNIEKFQNNCIRSGVATVVYIVQDEDEFLNLKVFSEEKKLKIDFLCFIDIVKCSKVMDENCSSFHNYKNHLKIGGYFLQIDGDYSSREAWVKKKYRGTQNLYGFPLVNEKHLEHYLKTAFEDKRQIIVEANGDRAVDLVLNVVKRLKENQKFVNSKLTIQNNGLLSVKQIKMLANLGLNLIRVYSDDCKNFFIKLKKIKENKLILKLKIDSFWFFREFSLYETIFYANQKKDKVVSLNVVAIVPTKIFCEAQKVFLESGFAATFCIVGENIEMVVNGDKIN